MKTSIAKLATSSTICGALILGGASSALAARPDDRGPSATVVSTVALHNDTAERGSDCPDDINDWWHFVIAPNNDRYSIDEMILELDGSSTLVTASSIVRNGRQTDNIFVQVPSGSTLESLAAAGSSATVSGPDSAARLMLSHLCEASDDRTTGNAGDDVTDTERDGGTPDDETDDDSVGEDPRDDAGDGASDDDKPITTVPEIVVEEPLPGTEQLNHDDDIAVEISDTTRDPVAEEAPSTGVPGPAATELPTEPQTAGSSVPSSDVPAPITPAESSFDSPAPEMSIPAVPTGPDTTATALPRIAIDGAPSTDGPALVTGAGVLPATGVALLVTPALFLLMLGGAVRQLAVRRS